MSVFLNDLGLKAMLLIAGLPVLLELPEIVFFECYNHFSFSILGAKIITIFHIHKFVNTFLMILHSRHKETEVQDFRFFVLIFGDRSMTCPRDLIAGRASRLALLAYLICFHLTLWLVGVRASCYSSYCTTDSNGTAYAIITCGSIASNSNAIRRGSSLCSHNLGYTAGDGDITTLANY